MKDCYINIRGKGNKVFIGDNCHFIGLRLGLIGDNNTVIIGNNVGVNAFKVKPTAISASGGTTITIEDNCLFSQYVEIHTTDYHGIYDEFGERINPDKDIFIGKHTWIGLGVKILKGTHIGANTIVGAGALCSGLYESSNVIIAGMPAKVIKHKVHWNDKRLDKIQLES